MTPRMRLRRTLIGYVAGAAFVLTVYLANLAVKRWGTTSVGFGLSAPAGVWFAGLAFTLRDVTHRCLGRGAVMLAILLGAAWSYALGVGGTLPGGIVSLAAASGIAFGLSELADLSVYEPIRARGWLPAVAASNVVGLVLDSALFLWLAFGSDGLHRFFWGQVVGKAWMTAAAIAVLGLWRFATREPVPA